MKELLRVFKGILKYLWKTKRWWIVPLVCLLLIIGILIFTTSAAPVPIFLYPLG